MHENQDTPSVGAAARRAAHQVAFKTDIGRSHRVNQDAGGAWSWVRDDDIPVSLLLVADGVSAGRRSEEVSRLVSDLLLQHLEPLLQDDTLSVEALLQTFIALVRDVNRHVAMRPQTSPASADATTLVAAFCVGDSGAGVWVGDSRAYRIGERVASQLTRDHSWAEGAISQGFMTHEQAASDPRAHMITRWLGPPGENDPGVETFAFKLEPGEVIMCCSDGLYGYFSPPTSRPEEMARVLNSHLPDLQRACDHLVDLALERGGHDNITLAALLLEPRSSHSTV